jgi:hypothetical protein
MDLSHISTSTLQQMQRDLKRRLTDEYRGFFPDLYSEGKQQKRAIGNELLRRDLYDIGVKGILLLVGSAFMALGILGGVMSP